MEYFNPWDYSALYIKDEIWSMVRISLVNNYKEKMCMNIIS